MRRRDIIAVLGGAAASRGVWPLAARAQQPVMPVIGWIGTGSASPDSTSQSAFRKGLGAAGFFEGKNAVIEYRWADNEADRLPELAADLVRRRVAVIVTGASGIATLAAKAATTTIPIIFAAPENPVTLGWVASLARPGGNLTGVNFFVGEVNGKRLGLFHQLIPKATRIALLVNPTNTIGTERNLRGVEEAANVMGLHIQIFKASKSDEIDAAFAAMAGARPDGIFVAGDPLFGSRGVQLATLAARERIPSAFANRDNVVAGGLMSYGTSFTDTYRQLGIYVASILKGTKPADLPVIQSTRFEFVINLQTAKLLEIDVPPMVLALTDEVIQ